MKGPVQLYPLVLEPIYKPKVWGGRSLERLGRTLPGDEGLLIGESWEVADLATTSTSGGGGGPARSRIANGPLAGRTLGEVLREAPRAVLGDADAAPDGSFPLLVKYLDARENLSVQVHPPPEYAALHAGAHVKHEAWYVVDAEPGAVMYLGLRPGCGRDEVEAVLAAGGSPDGIADLLVEVPAAVGDLRFLPSGLCHALGAGLVVAEVQVPSDTTFRVHDWGREGRELHVSQALECIELFEEGGRGGAWGPAAPFRIDPWSLARGMRRAVAPGGVEVWMVVRGGLRVSSGDAVQETVEVDGGGTLLLPSALGALDVLATADTVALRISLPAAADAPGAR